MFSGIKRVLFLALTGFFLVGGIAACGSGDELEVETSQNDTVPAPIPVGSIQPNVHTNVPPPAPSTEDTAKSFFGKKEVYDNFSQGLKDRIFETYTIDPAADLAGNGNGYYNTLMGRSAPVVYHITSGDTIPGIGCDPTGSFLCLDSPENEFETIHAGIDVIGNLDLNQLAVFGADDPVAVVSVFNNSGGGAASEILVMPGDVQETADPNVGRFNAAVGLSGAGKFTIVVSAYRVINEGAANELVSVLVTGTRLEPPEIEFFEARPEFNKLAAAGHEKDPVGTGAVIASTILNVKIKLLTAGGDGVQTKFENYDDAGNFQSVVAALPVPEGSDTFITGKVPLHQGVNQIKIISRVPAIDKILGDDAPDPVTLDFMVFNVDGGPKIKLIKPTKRGLIVPQNVVTGQKVELEFCYTFIPSKIDGHAGGSGAPPPPAIGDTCMGGTLGFTPEVFVNGKKVTGSDNFSYDASSGVFEVKVAPDFGVNLSAINATEEFSSTEEGKSTSQLTGAFVFGTPMALINNGQIASEKTFTQRGLNLDIDKTMLQGDIKTLLVKFLNREETSDLVLNIFKKTANTAGYVCGETDGVVVSNGDTTINFNPDTFDMGTIDLTTLTPSSDGTLHLGARINGMHGEAELRAAEPSGNTFNGKDLGFIPVNFAIASLEINVGVAFKKSPDGVSLLDLRQIGDQQVVTIVGDGPLGRPIYVDSGRNPLAAGLELLDWQQGLLLTQFNSIIGGTLLCGVESGLNNANSGAIGKNVIDIENLLSTNKNPFRIPINFNFLGHPVQFDLAYNIMRGTIKIDAQGIPIQNAPLRVNPGPVQLIDIAADLSEGIIGAVSRWKDANESSTQQSLTTAEYPLSLQVGEDVINQGLNAAALSGLINLTIDANFYTNLGAIPAEKLAPNGVSLAPGVDLDFDGQDTELDRTQPVSLEIKVDKGAPPMMTFLSKAEVQALALEESERRAEGENNGAPDPSSGPTPSDVPEVAPFFTPEGKYFRLALANLELTAYLNERISDELGGTQTFCKRTWSDPPSMAAKGFCQLSGDVLIPGASPLEEPECEGGTLLKLPRLNGSKISYGPGPTPDTLDQVIPLYRMKGGLILHGKLSGVDRDISYKEKVTNPNPPVKTWFHIQFAPKESAETAMVLSMEMVENNTGVPDASLIGNFDTVLTGGFTGRCQNLNELRLPLPEKFPTPKPGEESEPLLPDFGIDSIDLGGAETLPQVFIDDNHLYLDVLLHIGLKYTE